MEKFLCPICFEDLNSFDEIWRQIHINSCISKSNKKINQIEICPICNLNISNLSINLANKHINKCMDENIKNQSLNRKTERCPYCGISLKGISNKERLIHDQTCEHVEKIQKVDVIKYPKIVENLPTPKEWELFNLEKNNFNNKLNFLNENIPNIGLILNSNSLQNLDNYFFTNIPFKFE